MCEPYCGVWHSLAVSVVLQNPYGQFDAWAIWNFRARFLFLSGGNWQVVFTIVNDWQHTDYPLLLPLNVARLWFFFAEENSIGPILLSVTFFTATLGIMFTALRQIRSMFHAIIAVFLLLATPFFIWQGAAQYADIPLGFYFLLVVVLLAFYDLIGTWQLLFLAGMAAGFAAWTKNEGLLFVLVFFLAHGLLHVVSKHRQQQSYWWELKALGLGLMPVLLMLLFFKYYLAAPNDVVNQESDIVPKLLNAARYSVTGQMFLQIGLNVANIPLLVLPVYLFLMGVDKAKLKRPFLPIICLTFLLLMVGYFMIYIVTPYDLTWHLLSSLQRLYLQIWPSLIFITIFVSAYPQTTTKREGEKPA